MSKAPRILFRDKLISEVSRTGYAKKFFDEEQLEEISEKLGVRLDVLLEARLLYRERAAFLGKASGRLEEYRARRKSANLDYASIALHADKRIRKALNQYAEGRGLAIHSLIRSIYHTYLLGSWEPPHMHSVWLFHGLEGHKLIRSERVAINTAVTPAAKEALNMRAERLHSTIEELGRTLVVETVRGGFGKLGQLSVVTRKQMYTDLQRYQTRFHEDAVQVPNHLDFGGDAEEEPG